MTTEIKESVTAAQVKKERWEGETLAKVLDKTPERKASFEGISLEPVDRLYSEADVEDLSEIGMPGEYPYKRGIHPTGYRGKLWTMRQFAGFFCLRGQMPGSNICWRRDRRDCPSLTIFPH